MTERRRRERRMLSVFSSKPCAEIFHCRMPLVMTSYAVLLFPVPILPLICLRCIVFNTIKQCRYILYVSRFI